MWILFTFIGVAVFLLVFVLLRTRRRRMPAAAAKKIRSQWAALQSIHDPARRVLEADSLLDHALKAAGYSGSLGEKLKKMGSRFSNLDAIWRAHKLRNKIAHEPGTSVSEKEAEKALKVFWKGIEELM